MALTDNKVFRAAPELLWALEDLLEVAEFAHAVDPKNPMYEGWAEIIDRAKDALVEAGYSDPVDTSKEAWRDQRKD